MLNKALKRKLNSNEGASLMVALLFFVMCATIGSIILAAATASNGRLKNLEKEDQSYYVTYSAAQAVSDLVAGEGDAVGNKIQFCITYDKANELAPDRRNPKDSITLKTADGDVGFMDGSSLFLPNLLYQQILTYLTSNVEDLDTVFTTSNEHSEVQLLSEKNYMDLTVKKGGTSIDILSSRAVFAMNDNLDLFVSIRPLNNDTDRNNITLTFYAVKKLEESVQKVELIDGKKYIYQSNTYSIYWSKPFISKGSIVSASGGGE